MTYLKLTDFGRVAYKMDNKERVVKSFHEDIGHALELLVAGALPNGKRNLMICMPPRHGKSDLISVDFPAWCMGHIPDCEFILASCTIDLARDMTSRVSETMSQTWFKEMFPACRKGTALTATDKNRMDSFKTTMGGKVKGVGSSGTIIGFGAGKLRKEFGGAFIIDDPIKQEEASSATIRKKVVNWYLNTAKTRLNSKSTPMILVMQRLHPDDLAGYILQNEAEDWHVVTFEALDLHTKTALWEERKSAHELLAMKEHPIEMAKFWTQYQQIPVNPGGNIVKRDWWHYYSDIEEVKKRCTFFAMFADTAMKEKQHNDASCISLWGFEGADRAYKIDRIKGRWDFPTLVVKTHEFWNKWNDNKHGKAPKSLFIEDKVSGTSLIQTLRKEYTDPDTGTKYKPIPVIEWAAKDFELDGEDKVSRVKACSWNIHGGDVWMPDEDVAPWVGDCIDEWSNFAEDMSHSHDDEVDTDTMAILTWKAMGGGL